ncbi:hypothetical protein OGAPHI_000019 [Ogataea philodendri]|uniref:Uncharacterized protein n=1 Tax=Ogataea philodendri TaxID=1378263 RepID=A0A9P8PGG6_9ASCO|nr:uncharacterized protein OGAPHI_000019 [Ogataea philodendri]KAH3671833.1 hypothetical protein OGAPHI_000019 [Ogataea philodendri]
MDQKINALTTSTVSWNKEPPCWVDLGCSLVSLTGADLEKLVTKKASESEDGRISMVSSLKSKIDHASKPTSRKISDHSQYA